MDNIQQITDACKKVYSVQQGSARQTRLRTELCNDTFHAVLAYCGQAKCQCCLTTVMAVVYSIHIY